MVVVLHCLFLCQWTTVRQSKTSVVVVVAVVAAAVTAVAAVVAGDDKDSIQRWHWGGGSMAAGQHLMAMAMDYG